MNTPLRRRTRDHHEWLVEKLKNVDRAVSYLRAALEDSHEAFATAVENVTEAHFGGGSTSRPVKGRENRLA